MSETTVNVPLLRKAVEWAEAEAAKPWQLSEWNQSRYVTEPQNTVGIVNGEFVAKSPECGTCFCIAGYVAVAVLDANLSNEGAAHNIAADALNLRPTQANLLFDGGNTIEDVRRIAESIAGERL